MRRRNGFDQSLPENPFAGPAEGVTPPQAQRPTQEPARLVTEFEFELPRGYVDSQGEVHRHGTMRLATARDELVPQIDIRVKDNPAYFSVVLLSLVITRIGTVTDVHAGVVESMYATDVAFL